MFKVLFTSEEITSIKADLTVSAFACEKSDAQKIRTASCGLPENEAQIGLIKWVDGDSGEEEVLRSGLKQILTYAVSRKSKKIAFNVTSFEKYFKEISYLANNISESIEECIEDADSKTSSALNRLTIIIPFTRHEIQTVSSFESFCTTHSPQIKSYRESISAKGKPKTSKFLNPQGYGLVSYVADDAEDGLEDFHKFMNSKEREKEFREYLLEVIDSKKIKKFSTVYKASGISKYTFSKILSYKFNPPHQPSRETVAALCIGLKLDLNEAVKMYNHAGYNLSANNIVDTVLRYSIHNKIYDIDEVNILLSRLHVAPLGEKPRQSERSGI